MAGEAVGPSWEVVIVLVNEHDVLAKIPSK